VTLAFEVTGRNTAGPPARHLWTVDTTPPTVTIDSTSRTGPDTAEVTFRPSESESRIECVLLQLSREGAVVREVERVAECTSPWVFEDLMTEVAYRVQVSATDAARNIGPPAEADIDASSLD
jgi:hypothetical protein